MSKNKPRPEALTIPDDVQEKAKNWIKQAFELFANLPAWLAREAAEFDKEQKEVEGRIKRGARRTDGRIV